MKLKEDAVKRIVETAELLSFYRKMPIYTNSTYDYYNTNNISNTTTDPAFERQMHFDMHVREKQYKCEEPFRNPLKHNVSQETKEAILANQNRNLHCEDRAYYTYKNDYFRHLPLIYHPQFKVPVNLNFSCVLVATSIYARDDDILNDVRWSEALDLIFKYNLESDPTLTWQFFAGTTGFLRHYPAVEWSQEKYDKTFDFRTRAWYLESISSPKDLVIVLDMSGSMWEQKWNIAKVLVNFILDTLGDNDHVNVYLFNNVTHPLVDCFNYTLMQAHEENLRLLRESLDKHSPSTTGNMKDAIRLAQNTLENFRNTSRKTDEVRVHCNQIIILIAEGIDYDYDPTDTFNTKDRDKSYYTPIRVFTFLIGTVASDAAQMEWIACANMGYYVNISRNGDIAEKVLKYLQVLSRPLNLNQTRPKPIWTGTYVDLADRRLTNWLWNKHEGNLQRQIFVDYTREAYDKYNCMLDKSTTDHFLIQTEHEYSKYLNRQKYTYTTTVALPVYDKRPGQVTVLGVAGIDIPIEYFKMMTMPHRIGVNGYAFILTNNGLLLLHPDHRTEFENIIKPTFNRVDLTEAEIVDDDNGPRDFNKEMLEMREEIVTQQTGYRSFHVKTHLDDMKRVILNKRHYYYTDLGPFSLGVVMPDKYGNYRILYDRKSLYDIITSPKENLSGLNDTKNWKIHPEWRYCKHYGKERMLFKTPESELMYFLYQFKQYDKLDKVCNTGLVRLFIRDAKMTQWYEDIVATKKNLKFDVKIVFMATHSGLTRWKSYTNEIEPLFIKTNNKAIDEVWYKRSIEYYYNDPEAFLYSIPFVIENITETIVTATSSVFAKTHAPAAVVGLQFAYTDLNIMFYNITSSRCDSADHSCFLLDNNAYILVSEDIEHTGKFFGIVRPAVMRLLIDHNIYNETRMFDYQGICYIDPPKPKTKSPGHRFKPILANIFGILNWIFTSIMSFIHSAFGAGVTKITPCQRANTSEYEKRAINKSLPTPCDRESWLYTLKNRSHVAINTEDSPSIECFWNYIVQPVLKSNLIILVVNEKCEYPSSIPHFAHEEPQELLYNESMPCYIATKNNYTRRRYNITCIDKHDDESKLNLEDKKYCGITWT